MELLTEKLSLIDEALELDRCIQQKHARIAELDRRIQQSANHGLVHTNIAEEHPQHADDDSGLWVT